MKCSFQHRLLTVDNIIFFSQMYFQAIELTFHRKTLLVSEYSDKIIQRICFLIMNSIGTAKVRFRFYFQIVVQNVFILLAKTWFTLVLLFVLGYCHNSQKLFVFCRNVSSLTRSTVNESQMCYLPLFLQRQRLQDQVCRMLF